MDTRLLIVLVFGFLATASGALLIYFHLNSSTQRDLRSLMGGGKNAPNRFDDEDVGAFSTSESRAAAAKTISKIRPKTKAEKISLEDKFFQAGILTDEQKAKVNRLRIICPIVSTLVLGYGGYYADGGGSLFLVSVVLGVLVGLQAPNTILDRKILARGEEILYFLPLVIEQIAIGVSSSLDIGPCVQKVVSMADERDSHNVVTELMRIVVYLTKSGLSLEDALNEVGKRAGQVELKHAFMSLSQVARHGGEITRQLQELADAVSNQRETKIESKIKKLELEATLPVAMVFAGFMVILLVGFFLKIKGAFE